MSMDKVINTNIKYLPILGEFTGESADSNITNLNGLDITREVWEAVFNSDEYKQAISMGWYIGYLGHPEAPDCMDFKNACIVMTDGYIGDDGKIYAKFNLIDTPVGRIVKSFIDAGVTFGISVRGAGDVTGTAVDPGTFVFRGFDLVTFPAYPNSIPEFKAIAASVDAVKQQHYKMVCASVKNNLPSITDCNVLSTIQSQFSENSDTYQSIEQRKSEIASEVVSDELQECKHNCDCAALQDKLNGITDLYVEALDTIKNLEIQIQGLSDELACTKADYISCTKKLNSVKRIMSKQISDLEYQNDQQVMAATRAKTNYERRIRDLSTQLSTSRKEITASNKEARRYAQQLGDIAAELETSKQNIKAARLSEKRIKEDSDAEIQDLKGQLQDVSNYNLKYKQELKNANTALDEANTALDECETVISGLHEELSETVNNTQRLVTKTSHLDAHNKQLQAEITASQKLLREYQEAYKTIYANAVGASTPKVRIGKNTSVSELQNMINDTTSAANYTESEYIEDSENVSNVFVQPQPIDLCDDSEEMITL